MKDLENKLKYIYRDYVAGEVSRPEVRQAKKNLIASHFNPKPAIAFDVTFALSAMVLGVAFLMCFYFKPVPTKAFQPVEVKRVASRVGPTMVYQKNYQDVPITIVWVFAGGNPA